MSTLAQYVLGSDQAEIARLERQAASIAPATALLLKAAGVAPGMEVLDLGTGLGHVALQVAELVGPGGSVLGIDQDPTLLKLAEQRARAVGAGNVHFQQADVRTFRRTGRFDAVVGRLILFHLPDAVDVLRHHIEALVPGGLVAVIDFDTGSVRGEPAVELITSLMSWVQQAFRHAGANPTVGTQLALILRDAGLEDISSFGVQDYFAPEDPHVAALLASVMATLAPHIIAAGIATEAELGLDTLQQRIADETASADAVSLTPTVVGAWGRAANGSH